MEPILGNIGRLFGYPLTVVLPWRARGLLRATLSSLFAAALLWPCQPALAQFRQDGNMLGSRCDGLGGGYSVALSGDGTTAIVGAAGTTPPYYSAYVYTVTPVAWSQQGCGLFANGYPAAEGAVAASADGNTVVLGAPTEQLGPNAYSLGWVFARSGGTWSQQVELIGSNVNGVSLGTIVALSADGDTAIVGVSLESNLTGAAWVFTRSSGVWSQQGPKLVGTGAIGEARQGESVALSGDGNTAIVGGLNDNNGVGAAWVFTRSNGVWTQEAKLIGSDAVGAAHQGSSIALSGDGNTAIVGGPQDNNSAGAVWVFTRSGGQWTQQGGKLVGTGAVGTQVNQGRSVGLSGDGNLAIVGGPFDNGGPLGNEIGAAWLFTRSDGIWSQLQKLVSGEANFPQAFFGASVALSADGRTALVGAPGLVNGGAFLFIGPSRRATDTHDFNGDGKSDIAWGDGSGNTGVWLMNGVQVTPAGVGSVAAGWSIVGQRDFNGDGKADWLWRDGSGNVGIWFMNGAQATPAGVGTISTVWSVAGTGDFNGDGKGDILWQDTSGNVGIWFMNGAQVTPAGVGTAPAGWSIAGTGDFNGDGKSDILWQDGSGNVGIWFMNGAQVTPAGVGAAPAGWSIAGVGDFNGDGESDILWQHTSGVVGMWFMNGAQVTPAGVGSPPAGWSIQRLNAD
jgi:VCBS repeat protein/FG-GAP repeat protein